MSCYFFDQIYHDKYGLAGFHIHKGTAIPQEKKYQPTYAMVAQGRIYFPFDDLMN